MIDKRKYKPQFPLPGPVVHRCHDHPDININVNNNGDVTNIDDDKEVAPAVFRLMNRVNKLEHDVKDNAKDIRLISKSLLKLGDGRDQAYPGYKGKQNEISISLLNERVDTKADKSELPNPEIFYLNLKKFPEEPTLSGFYINAFGESKFWDGSQWIDINIKHSSIIDANSTDNEGPTSKAVYDLVSTKADKVELENYVKHLEINDIIEGVFEKHDEQYDSLLSGVVKFKKNIFENLYINKN